MRPAVAVVQDESLRDRVATPLVTVVVRSMDRPELDLALGSIARQDYPAVEVIVVDATGGRHAPLRPQAWAPGHHVRLVSSGQPLKRPLAADFGLAVAAGEWFTFLDDDDTCEPSHLSSLVAAACARPEALVVYGKGRLFNADGTLDRVFGRPFNRALMHYGPLFYWQAALIRTRVRDFGCRFDPAFDVCEDRDLLAQIAEHGDFVFIPGLATFNYRPDLGTSGTGNAGNRNFARVARYENRLRAKWAGSGTFHNERVATLCRRGVRAFLGGDVDAAEGAFDRALKQYPDDPNALHGLARVAIARGDRARAEALTRTAIDINPLAAEYRSTLAQICGPNAVVAGERTAPLSRTAACPCGSGKRYKACCGRIDAGLVAGAATSGSNVEALCASAQQALDGGELQAAFDLLDRAAAIRCDATVGRMLETCCERLAAGEARASVLAMLRQVRDGQGTAGAATPLRRVLVVGRTAEARAGALQAARASGLLATEVEVTESPALDANARAIDHSTGVLFCDPEDVPSHGVVPPIPGHAAIAMPRDDPASLLRGLARLYDGWAGTRFEYLMVNVSE